jgi:hypothetical protein
MKYLEVIKTLYNISNNESYGFNELEIEKAEKRLNIILPKSLRQYYLSLGKNKAINETFNHLLLPDQIDFTDDKYLIFYEENQAVVLWGIYEKDFSSNNPKIYGSYDNERSEWFLDSENTEDFLLSMAYWNGVLGGLKYTANVSEDLDQEIINKIEQNWKEQKNITQQMLRFFTNDNLEILVFTTDHDKSINGLYIGSNDKEKYEDIIKKLDIEWDYRSDQDETSN